MEEKMQINIKEVFQSMYLGVLQEQKRNKIRIYKMLNQNVNKEQIVLVGSSLMEWFPIKEMLQSQGITLKKEIYNRGIASFTTTEFLQVIDTCVFDLEPSKIFINIGSNDIGAMGSEPYKKENLLNNYKLILEQIKTKLPNCKVYVMAYYPINTDDDFGLDPQQKIAVFSTRTNSLIAEANDGIEKLTKTFGFEYINVNNGLTDTKGNLKKEFAIEGMHLLPNAYELILSNLMKYLV